MRYWWVNQGRSQKHQIAGGFIWSPKVRSDGRKHGTYTNLTRTSPGDIVYSFARGNLRAIGRVSGSCEDRPKPIEFGIDGMRWGNDGHAVSVDWKLFSSPFRPADYADRLFNLFERVGSPYSLEQRKGMQGTYLSEIREELAIEIADIAAGLGDLGAVRSAWASSLDHLSDAAEFGLRNRSDLDGTTRMALVLSRRGQGRFRDDLLALERLCRVTQTTHPDFLVASHIKPWAVSSNFERLDPNNGLLLAPHVDRLFDHGWISFTDDGEMLVSGPQAAEAMTAWGIAFQDFRREFSVQQRRYLAYHRKHIFGRIVRDKREIQRSRH